MSSGPDRGSPATLAAEVTRGDPHFPRSERELPRERPGRRRPAILNAAIIGALAAIAAASVAACGHMSHVMGGHAEKPAPSEFGYGPRPSVRGLYSATLAPVEPLRVRHMQTVHVLVSDSDGRPIEDANIDVDGGMPEHGHGLPTRPRVTRSLGGGRYEVEGVKFNMGGWWELRFAISTGAPADTVTFNLDL